MRHTVWISFHDATQVPSQECDECVDSLFRALFHQPMSRILELDLPDSGRDKLHLRAQDCGAGFISGYGQDRQSGVNASSALSINSPIRTALNGPHTGMRFFLGLYASR
jgi:hypothetical protein